MAIHEIADNSIKTKERRHAESVSACLFHYRQTNALQSMKPERHLEEINRRSSKFFRRFIFANRRSSRSGLRCEFPNSLFRMAISVFRLCVGNKERKRKPCDTSHCAFASFVSVTGVGILPVWSAVTSSRRLLLFDREICNVLSVCPSWSSLRSILYPTFPPCIPND